SGWDRPTQQHPDGGNDRREGPRSGFGPPPQGNRGPQRAYVAPRPQPSQYRNSDWDQPYRGSHQGRWQYAPLLTTLIRAFIPSSPRVLGAAIVAWDNTFLGVISRDTNDPDSVASGWGRFGSPESPYSLWNLEGRWGSQYAEDSPWNPYATRPPRVYDGDEFRGYLSTNANLHPRVDPEWLRSYLYLPRW
ncbi:MAG: hypothetical protein WCP21_15810, partial [Armatimonadota bacterium]